MGDEIERPGDIDAEIERLVTSVAEAQESAAVQIEESNETIARGTEKTRRIVTIVILGIYSVALAVYALWVIFAPSTIPGYVCADEAAQQANLCTGRWVQTTAALKDLVVTWILPIVTLSIGYYFGKSVEVDG